MTVHSPRLFYGWYIVAASVILMSFNSMVFIYGWTAFVDPIVKTFHWSVAQVSLASSLRGIETGIFNPIWGAAADRFRPNRLMLFGVACVATGTFVISRTTSLPMYYAGFLIMGMGGSLVTGILPTVVIARWFRRDIGKANGVFSMRLGIGGVLVPLVVILIDRVTWQTVLLYAAAGFVTLGIPLSFVFRSRPEDYRLLPDGRPPEARTTSPRRSFYDFSTTVRQALRMRAFWFIAVITVFQNATIATVTMFIIPYLTSMRMPRPAAGAVVSAFTILSLFTRIPLGMSADRFRKKYVIAFTIVLLFIGLLAFRAMDGDNPLWLVALFCVTYGVGMSGINALRPPILAEYFGTRNFGAIFGLTSIAITVAGVTATPLAGWIFDEYGTYKPFWLGLAGFALIALALTLTLPPPPENTLLSQEA